MAQSASLFNLRVCCISVGQAENKAPTTTHTIEIQVFNMRPKVASNFMMMERLKIIEVKSGQSNLQQASIID